MKKSYQLWCFGLQAAKIPTLTSLTNKPTVTCLDMRSSEKMGYRAEWSNSSVMSLRTCFFLVSLFFLSNGTPLQYSCLENPMDGGSWRAVVHGVAKSRTRLSNFTFTFHFHTLEEEMATHSSVLAWRIPGTGEPGGLPSMGSHRVRHNWSDLAAAAAAAAVLAL